jgi:hypothetical protein
LLALGVGLALLLTEGVGRLFGHLPARPSSAYLALTRRVGPLPPPRSAVLSESAGEFRRWIAFNDLGFRGPATQFSPDAGRSPRLLVAGDSYTSAWQVALEERFTERLEGLEPPWSVLNLGMPNWGTDQQYLLLGSYPLARAADIVILLLTPLNDIADNGRALLVGPPNRPYFVPAPPHAGEPSLREIPWTYRDPFEDMGRHPFPLNLRTWLSLHSVAYRGARDLRGVLARAWAKPSASPSLPPGSATIPIEYGIFAVDRTDPRWEAAWTITDRLLALMGNAARAQGAELRIVLVPHYATVQPELTPVFVVDHPAHFDLTRAHSRVTSIARAQGVPLLDLTPAFVQFRQADPRRRPLFFAHDKHFTPLGHCLTAALVAQWLVPTGRSAPLDACR